MPIELAAVNAVNAVWFVSREAPWPARMASLWRELGAAPAVIDAGLEVLARRAAGGLDWNRAFAGGVLPSGRPCPPVRRYNDLLASDPTMPLPTAPPLVRVPPLVVAFDVWGDGERAGEPDTIGLEMLVHRDGLRPWRAGAVLDDGTVVDVGRADHYERLTRYGDAFAALMARGCELLMPAFALADGLQPVGDFLARAQPDRVRHPAPEYARLADYAWALAYWTPDRTDPRLAQRLAALRLPARSASAWPDGVEPSVRTLATGGTFLRVRRILGGESRGDRASVETALAQALGLRSNHLLHRT